MKRFAEFTLISEAAAYDVGVSHKVTMHRGHPDHAVGKHLDTHHAHEDHAGYVHIHTSKDGRHKYHAQIESGAHDDGVNTHAHYIHHDTRTGKVQDIPSHVHSSSGKYKSYKTHEDFAKHVEKTTGHKMDSESAKAVHHHHEVNAHEHAYATERKSSEALPKHIRHLGHNTPGFRGHDDKPTPSHHNVKYEHGYRVAKHQEDGIYA